MKKLFKGIMIILMVIVLGAVGTCVGIIGHIFSSAKKHADEPKVEYVTEQQTDEMIYISKEYLEELISNSRSNAI